MGVTEKIKQREVKTLYKRLPSLLPWLPWQEYLSEEKVFILEDALSCGVMFDVRPVAVEARGVDFLATIKRDIENLFNNAIPQEDPPFILEIYTFNSDHLNNLKKAHADHVSSCCTDPRFKSFSDAYVEMNHRHWDRISDSNGYFEDTTVTKNTWRGLTRSTKCFFYRRLNKPTDVLTGHTPISEINDAYEAIVNALSDAGMVVTKEGNRQLYEWLFPWFNAPVGANSNELFDRYPYPGDENLPFGVNLNSLLFLEQPYSECDQNSGHWQFASGYHKALAIDGLRRVPTIGHISAELPHGDKDFAFLDRMPKDTIFVMAIVFLPKDITEAKIGVIKDNARGDHHEAKATFTEAERALQAIAAGNNLFPCCMTVLTRSEDLKRLHRRCIELNSLFVQNGFSMFNQKDDLLPVNQYIRAMPFNYDYRLDKDERRNRLVFASHLANLAPFYGRSRGTKHPGMVFFNRGGEDIAVDFITDRETNAFGTVIGPPGSGKSSWLNAFIQYAVGVHRARVFIFEKGGSFELQSDYAKTHGLSVNRVVLKPGCDISLPTFSNAIRLAVEEEEQNREVLLESDDELKEKDDFEDSDEEELKRDLLGEMEQIAKLMITGGEKKEIDALRRSDRRMIRAAIRMAGRRKLAWLREHPEKADAESYVLPEDVARCLYELSKDTEVSEDTRLATEQMAASMELFCDGIAGQLFNRPGKEWEEADITTMEFGILAQDDDYSDSLILSFISLMTHINYVVERDEEESRPTIIIGDEAHLYLKFPLLAVYIVKAVKMWRKLGAWLWLATQNLDDLSQESEKLLRMFQWILALTPPKGEADHLAKIRDLTPTEVKMLTSCRKEAGKFTEGVLLSPKLTALFRAIPPPEIFAMGMTEKDEKSLRKQIMTEHGLGKFEAAMQMAEGMIKK